MKKIIFYTLLITALLCTSLTDVGAITDDMIFADNISNIYVGRKEAAEMARNLSFADVSSTNYAAESIVRTGALDIVKGYENLYRPNDVVSNEEAIAFIMRVLGLENVATETAKTVKATMPPDSSLNLLWSIGYLTEAANIKLITKDQYDDIMYPYRLEAAVKTALAAETDPFAQGSPIPDRNIKFLKELPATREDVVDWLVRGIKTIDKTAFGDPPATYQAVYKFKDWEQIDVDKARSVEEAVANGILAGDENGNLLPKGSLTRAAMAQIIRNMDSIYYKLAKIERKTGTVGAIKDDQITNSTVSQLTRSIYVRTADGNIDVLQLGLKNSSSPQDKSTTDAVVYKYGKVVGLSSLEEGEQIEYLVRPENKTLIYATITSSPVETKTVSGFLEAVNIPQNIARIKDKTGKSYTYSLVRGIGGQDSNGEYIIIDGKKRQTATLPIGSRLEFRLKNNIVDKITYIGEPVVESQVVTKGIVVENNPDFGYITFIDNNGNLITKDYYDGDVKVKKEQYYSMGNEIGYIDEMFPNFKYNPLESSVSEIEPGDIIHVRVDPFEPNIITNISAATNYRARYGKIVDFVVGDALSTLVMQYEDGQTSWFEVPNDIYISKDGRPISNSDIHAGDYAKALINQALIEPGYVMESVKELAIEGNEHLISTILKGQLSGLDPIQYMLELQNAQTLTKTGWTNYKNIQKLSVANRDIEYYLDGKRISIDYALKNLKRANGEVYVALENNFTGEKVKKVTFRFERDELLSPDRIMDSNNGMFKIFSNLNSNIATDDGTIIRRFGRLVNGQNIQPSDYAVVSLNGDNRAAVIDILEAPDVSKVLIYRTKVENVNEGKNFSVYNASRMDTSANEWVFEPSKRTFTVDYNTLYYTDAGIVADEQFIGYGDNTAINKIYTVVVDGTKATHVIDAPFANKAIRGEIYQAADGNILLKNTQYYSDSTTSSTPTNINKWLPISSSNASSTITIPPNAVIVKNNKVVTAKALEAGDYVKVMTNTLPTPIAANLAVDGYLIFVEK